MFYRVAADAVLLLHLGFIVFVCFGAFLAVWRRWMPVVHVPCAAWGAWVEIAGATCPLTHLENRCRGLAGQAGYEGGFIEHYLLPVIYPAGLTREVQLVLAGVVVAINVAAYAWIVRRRSRPA